MTARPVGVSAGHRRMRRDGAEGVEKALDGVDHRRDTCLGSRNAGPHRGDPRSTDRRPGPRGHRLKLLFMSQTDERPPRFSIQVNSRARVTRDYAYYLENRLRERFGLGGIPLIIDFVERDERRAAAGRDRRGTQEAPA